MKNNKKETVDDIWTSFTDIFWLLFITHVVISFIAVAGYEPLVDIIGKLLVSTAMVYAVGSACYKFSNKKIYWFFGLLGLFWAGLVGIFVAYFVVKYFYKKSKMLKTI